MAKARKSPIRRSGLMLDADQTEILTEIATLVSYSGGHVAPSIIFAPKPPPHPAASNNDAPPNSCQRSTRAPSCSAGAFRLINLLGRPRFFS
jgi:hypothetical protein